MNNLSCEFLDSIVIGIGATLTLDVWALLLKHAFKITPSNFCLIGRWILSMPEGNFRHSNIGSVPQKRKECIAGWLAHYTIGIMFAIAFVAYMGKSWLQHPTLISAVIFGVVTVAAPFLIVQPALGLGVAASKVSRPWQARFRSLMNHIVFGIGLYLFGLLVNWLF